MSTDEYLLLGDVVEYEADSLVLSKEEFIKHMNRGLLWVGVVKCTIWIGVVMVVRGVAKDWPITGSTCEDFCRNEDLEGIYLEKLYGSEDGM